MTAQWKYRLLQKCKDKAKQSFRCNDSFFCCCFSFAILRDRNCTKRVMQASGEMTDTSVSEKLPVLQAGEIELQFDKYKKSHGPEGN